MKNIMFSSIVLGTLFLCPSLHAILSPLNQSVKELQEILASPELQNALPQGEHLEEILHVQEGFILSTNSKEILVEVQYDTKPHVGPLQYKLIFRETKQVDDPNETNPKNNSSFFNGYN